MHPRREFIVAKQTLEQGWTMVVAASENAVIGKGGELPWKLRSDLQRFKKMTMGHCLVMGRKTYESIGKPLPGRQTIVLSQSGFDPQNAAVKVAQSPDKIEKLVENGRKTLIVGGAEIYRLLLPKCDSIWLTKVLASVEGDTKLPDISWEEWTMVSSEDFEAGDHDDWPSRLEIWKRRN